MTTSSSNLVNSCFFRAEGVYCSEGYLYYSLPLIEVSPGVFQAQEHTRVMVEGEQVTCTACEGRGVLLTERGKQLLIFLDTFARPMLRDLVDELLSEKGLDGRF
jgi:hypothetical protein